MINEIPKVIHYCWFGGNPLPELAIRCIESWKKYCPDYEIIEWNESNFDVNCCDYVKEAYQAKKWAFVSDYARYKILYEQGGVYLDTDVELLKPIDDLVEKGNYMGCENYSDEVMSVNPGLGCATLPGNEFYLEIIDDYEKSHFENSNGSADLYTVVERTTDFLKKYGLKNELNIQTIAGITIYPAEYLCPIDMRTGRLNATQNSYSIHHCAASWVKKRDVYYARVLRLIYNSIGPRGFDFLRKHFGKKKGENSNDNTDTHV